MDSKTFSVNRIQSSISRVISKTLIANTFYQRIRRASDNLSNFIMQITTKITIQMSRF